MSLPDRIPARTLTALSGAPVPVPDPDCLIHLQFRRFAGCPVCNLGSGADFVINAVAAVSVF